MPELYSVDYRYIKDLPPIFGGYELIELTALAHCQAKIPKRPHIPLRFIGVVPQQSKFANRGFIWIPNCVDENYTNNIFSTTIEGIFCQAWSIIEPQAS